MRHWTGGLLYKNHISYKSRNRARLASSVKFFSQQKRKRYGSRGERWARRKKGDRSATRVQAETLRNNKNFIGPRVFDFASWRITAHIHISAFRVERAEYI